MTTIEIECPVKGVWAFLNPPGHHPDAKDFVAVDESGKPYKAAGLARHLFWKLEASKTFAWEKEILAPFAAVIVETENSCVDREALNFVRDVIAGLILAKRHEMNDMNFFLGNHVIMQSDSGIYALFAHIRKGSIRVKKGERVKTGDLIAAIGNSGNTIQPHLHFQLMKENSPFTTPPLPFVFTAYEARQGKTWKMEQTSLPKNGQVFRTRGAA
jgi:hypothetical protein